ncbi:MAG: tRNA pseudouridine(38-40) synthase TruA [Alphaproteobacteria bacterium]|nr:tRNA pseudouridine(38-40) synthase TruA [Alphaproteobacteria bacterium]
MPRFKLTIEYDGTDFVGWQRQVNGLSVQQVLEEAALAYCQTKIVVHGAGRTDAGVHALAQVAHVDLPRNDDGRKVRDALNAHLRPHPVAVIEAEEVADDFHSRFQATERFYVYRIVTRRAPVALEKNRAWWLPRDLDASAMHTAAQRLVGQHDFTSFRATECQAKTPVKTVYSLDVKQANDTIEVHAQARSFLHHQVRNIVGTLSLVGEGKWTADDVSTALAAKSRPAGGPTAPPEGLYLVEVRYPD